ncbi:hypothetical protein PI95_024580 [Hassallia byssoidea VB512170]|uniref:Uncharacterized protein n=1 Tax=Hassallia byssoidea VB512170 TaxID=1304833 RepID=A0A846HFR6_9CYAN|nr:hypothetical protein [Hassalia byssoidea]NEU75649.1 hypothetical protein [Hassalia byssoidea VB512170]
MGRNLKIAVAAILALAIASCASESEQASNPTPTPNSAPTQPPSAIQSFKNPVVPAKQAPIVASTTPNLIQPTNATERVIVVSKGRPDPFGQLFSPTYASNTNANTNTPTFGRSVPVLPPLPVARGAIITSRKVPTRSAVISAKTRIPSQPQLLRAQKNKINKINKGAIASARLPKPSPGFTPVVPKVLPLVVPNPTLVSVLPPPVQPELARAVLVTGVVLIGQEPQAIIKVPNEPTSRYVLAGQRLANGVLVKRIEMNEGSNPVVIFEQYGMEVARNVGESPINAASPATTPENPVSVTTPPQNPTSTGA